MDLYGMQLSAPCRSVAMLLKKLGLDYKFKTVNLMEGEQLKPEFIKKNPQHTVPTLDDHGFYIHESRAILQYLANQYGKDSGLYPSDPKARAVVDQMLYFDMGSLYQRFGDYVYPVMWQGDSINPEKKAKFVEAMGFLETYLTGRDFVCGDKLTIADIAILASISSFKACGYDVSAHPKVAAWFDKCIPLIPDYESANGAGAAEFAGLVKSKFTTESPF